LPCKLLSDPVSAGKYTIVVISFNKSKSFRFACMSSLPTTFEVAEENNLQ
jgi:hypothetical protein